MFHCVGSRPAQQSEHYVLNHQVALSNSLLSLYDCCLQTGWLALVLIRVSLGRRPSRGLSAADLVHFGSDRGEGALDWVQFGGGLRSPWRGFGTNHLGLLHVCNVVHKLRIAENK